LTYSGPRAAPNRDRVGKAFATAVNKISRSLPFGQAMRDAPLWQ